MQHSKPSCVCSFLRWPKSCVVSVTAVWDSTQSESPESVSGVQRELHHEQQWLLHQSLSVPLSLPRQPLLEQQCLSVPASILYHRASLEGYGYVLQHICSCQRTVLPSFQKEGPLESRFSSKPSKPWVSAMIVFTGIKGALRVAFNNNHSFKLSWNDSLRNAYECYTVEWLLKGGNAMGFRSFYSDKNHSVIDIGEGMGF